MSEFLTGVSNTIILNENASLASYYHSGETSWQDQIDRAKLQIVTDLRNQKKAIKKYLSPLSLQTDSGTALTSGHYSTASTEDGIERLCWVTERVAGSSTTAVYLLGSNDGTNYYFVNESESIAQGTLVASIANITFKASLTTTITKVVKLFTQPYKYYKIYVPTSNSDRIVSYLVEHSFHLAHLYLSMSLIMRSLILNDENPQWEKQADYYFQMYQSEMARMVATYDDNDSGEIDTDVEIDNAYKVRIYR